MPESDGTLEWNATTLVVVKILAENSSGLGFSYGHAADCLLIQDFIPFLINANVFDRRKLWEKMVQNARNIGSGGVASSAISAVDVALWDLQAKVLQLPLCELLGRVREKVPIYGSGGFTSYTDKELASQFQSWQAQGITKFKMKVGRCPKDDPARVEHARKVIGDDAELFVDANGGYTVKQALTLASSFAGANVSWFEEPVSSDNLSGLHFLRRKVPKQMNVAAGEYGYDIHYFRRMLEAHAVDIMQADATRCFGYTGFLEAASLCRAFDIPLSSHTAPSIHLHICLADSNVCHMEYFHDHVRIESRYFEGFPQIVDGALVPDLGKPGHGLELKEGDIEKFKIMG